MGGYAEGMRFAGLLKELVPQVPYAAPALTAGAALYDLATGPDHAINSGELPLDALYSAVPFLGMRLGRIIGQDLGPRHVYPYAEYLNFETEYEKRSRAPDAANVDRRSYPYSLEYTYHRQQGRSHEEAHDIAQKNVYGRVMGGVQPESRNNARWAQIPLKSPVKRPFLDLNPRDRNVLIGRILGGVLGSIPAIALMRDQPASDSTMQPRV